MALHLHFPTCEVCEGDLIANRREDSEEPAWGPLHRFFLPRERYRRLIASSLCDACWVAFATWHCRRRWGRRGAYAAPPFRQIYLWEWVAKQLEERARRLRPHYQRKARQGLHRYGSA